jgi:glycosyltransferase involved in cell wall biosynthesis
MPSQSSAIIRPRAENPLISVCCTTYNIAGIIETTLNSILSQKGDFNIEVIIHDDASTDGTREILKHYKQNYPEIFKLVLQNDNQYTEKNVSLGEIFSRHIIPHASGTYIAICDGDDYWTDDNKLQKQLRFLKSNDSYAGCFTNALILNEMDSSRRPYLTDLEEGAISDFRIFIGGGGLYPSSTLFFRKDALLQTDMYMHIMTYTSDLQSDTAFILALCTRGRIGYIDEVTSVYRRRPEGLFSSIKDNKKELSLRTERQIAGLKKLFDLVAPHQRQFLKRKISIESYFVLRYGNSLSRYRLLKNLHYKEWGKWILRM